MSKPDFVSGAEARKTLTTIPKTEHEKFLFLLSKADKANLDVSGYSIRFLRSIAEKASPETIAVIARMLEQANKQYRQKRIAEDLPEPLFTLENDVSSS